jgi:hypothetical protein
MRSFTRLHGVSVAGAMVVVSASGFAAVSCGGSSPTISGEGGPESGGQDAGGDHANTQDAHADASKHEGGRDAASDGPTSDGPGDAPSDTISSDAHDSSTAISCITNNTACTSVPTDECCGNVCVPGNCCDDLQCTTGTKVACQANVCAACDAVASNAYFVDPINGSDATTSSGSNKAGGTTAGICAFKTIGHAIAVIGKTPPAGTTITVLSDDSNAINGEVFPLAVPTNTIVQGASSSVKISVSGTGPSDGFDLTAAASGLTTLTLDGTSAATGARGVVVDTGSTSTTTLASITISGFSTADGIVVQNGGTLTVSPGTVSTSNLTGFHVTGTASASVTGSSSLQTSFNANKVGILVDGTGASISIEGTPGTGGNGTVVVNSNTGSTDNPDAVIFNPTPSGTGGFPAQSLIDGLVIWGSTNNGMHILGGAHVKVRNSYILNNGLDGIRVDTNVACSGVATACTSNNYSDIDLGNATGDDWGLNTVQDESSGSPNKAVGICFAPSAPTILSTLSLLADGNIFATINCSTTAGTLTEGTSCTTLTADDVGLPSTSGISIATDMCTN